MAPPGIDRYALPTCTDPAALAAAIDGPTPGSVWVETPTNPMLSIVDIDALAEVAHARARCSWSTTPSPRPTSSSPLDSGADVVVHSTTKYLGGHSDVVGGPSPPTTTTWPSRLGFLQNAIGAVPVPLDCYLVLRGVKTLAVRMDRHCENAAAIVDLLVEHAAVSTVTVPGSGRPPRSRRGRPADDGASAGMVSFRAAEDAVAAMRVTEEPDCSRWPSRSGGREPDRTPGG